MSPAQPPARGPGTDPRAAAAPGVDAPPKRRNTELALLGFAVVITIAGQCIVDITVTDALSPELATFSAWFAAIWLVAHLVVRRIAPYADPLILPCVALLSGIGLAMIHRLDIAGDQIGSAASREDAPVQLLWATVGLALFIGVLLVVRDHRVLSRYAYTLALVGIALLALPALLPDSISEVNGAKIWIRVAGFSIQPGEFAKICMIVFFAAYLVDKRDVLALASRRVLGLELPRGRDLGPVLVAWALSILVLVFERDLGSSLLLFGIFVVMLYVATERVSWLVIGLGLFAVGATAAYRLFGHVQARVDVWLDPFAYRNGAGYQLVQSLFGLGTGGLFGAGLGGGRPDQVPVAKTDFIAAALGEELGLFGLVAIIVVYLLLVERGLRTSLIVRDGFGKLLAAGLAFGVAWQLFVVLGGVTGLLPLTGLTTPFVAYGGSSLVANFALVAVLVRISDAARRPAAPPAPAPPRLGDAPTEIVQR
ncbi:FtsW/RodA/SpoVE family cell cycle protein [Modestobacter sp. I12A-02628]|uniref:FtsW/RodA/SpoVE family cell cycle protein n=1 Tax=Goekera deserti TaxID=2497753 RepID=A0A7K3WH89_9ACTN|nr:FtsW/RodA/SpoVE family cell cycle protein [Goekera deserti]MPR00108.1 FtsW/RodA/SpoVE family cell cycle protein [Goekera deserti]NDI49887.1 FtsW/RodA/SpoVE family cell cycle protein [Goekera deserti]NEL55249.1 FtsW/RodA/SpoVE family cell cycle protein [Goekera deserti]